MGSAAFAITAGLGCGDGPVRVHAREAKVACGMCRMGMKSERGCFWAVEIDGAQYTVSGVSPRDHDSHAPDGMCNVDRKATVAGTIAGKTFRAERFDLKPIEDGAIPDAPKFTPADVDGH